MTERDATLGPDERDVTLEAEEWYVLCNWLRERENRLLYALRPSSRDWEFVHDLRREIETPVEEADTAGLPRTVTLSERQVSYLSSFLRKRTWKLLPFPWRSRERREVRHLRDHLLAEAECSEAGQAETDRGD